MSNLEQLREQLRILQGLKEGHQFSVSGILDYLPEDTIGEILNIENTIERRITLNFLNSYFGERKLMDLLDIEIKALEEKIKKVEEEYVALTALLSLSGTSGTSGN